MTNQIVLLIINYIVIGVEAFSVTYVADTFFQRRTGKIAYGLSIFMLIILAIIDVSLLEGFIFPRITVAIILYCLWIKLNYDTSIGRSTVSAVLLVSFQWIFDELFLFLIVQMTDFNEKIFSNPYAYYALIYTAKLIELFILVLVRLWAQRKFQNHYTGLVSWLRVAIIPFSAVYIAGMMLSLLEHNITFAPAFFSCTLVLLSLDIVAILLLEHLEDQEQAMLDSTVLRQQLKLESEHIQTLYDAYSSQRKLTHDFNNQIAVLKNMIGRGASSEAVSDYLNKLSNESIQINKFIHTNRLVVDVILSQKIGTAQEDNISFDYRVGDLSAFPLSDVELVIILTNLIDNAIEACRKITDSDNRRILLKLLIHKDYAYIYIENYSNHVHIVNNSIKTTKDDTLQHGYGLKNIRAILRKNNADYSVTYDEEKQLFIFSAQIHK